VAASIPSPPPKPAPARVPLEPGAVVADRYRILELLGEGRSGTVYVVEHVLLQKKVALKVLHPELTDTPESVARFEREAMATARIEHPNVAAAIDFGKLQDGSRYLALEYVEGTSLRAVIEKGPVEVERALRIARQIADALAVAQGLEIVHRDLKPENVILVTRGGDPEFVKIIDFGMARIAVDEGPYGGPQALTKAGAVFGTPEYIPPEQGIGQRVDSRADMYALGVMLFEMIAGVRPYADREDLGIVAQQLTLPVPTFAERAPAVRVPLPVERLINRLLARRPQERIQRAEDLARALDQLLAGEEPALLAAAAPLEPLPAFALDTQLQLPAAEPPPVSDSSAQRAVGSAVSVADQVATKTGGPSAVFALEVAARRVVRAALALFGAAGVAFSRGTTEIRKRRDSLPEPLRGWLSRVPAASILVGGVLLLLLLFTQVGLWLHHAGASRSMGAASAAAASSSGAPETTVRVLGGAPSSPPLMQAPAAEKDANDPDTQIRSAQAKLDEGRDAEAVSIVSRVLGKHPARRNDDRVAHILFRTASSNASGVANSTFSLLQGTMAAQGAEILYQLAIDKSVPNHVRARAEKWLHSPQFDRAASDALRVAARLRLAPTCESKHAMLPMAAKAGGTAALVYLRELRVDSGCGLSGTSDCYTCLRKDSQLSDAIEQIEARQRR